MALRDTIEHFHDLLERGAHRAAPSVELVAAVRHQAALLFERIESVYLLEYLIYGRLSLKRYGVKRFSMACGAFDLDVLRIRAGERVVDLIPHVERGAFHVGLLTMGDDAGGPVQRAYLQQGRDGCFMWCVPAEEHGLRRLLARFLPLRLVPLDETWFASALDRALLGHQPILSYDREVVRERLGDLLDKATAAELDIRVAHVARTRWLPQMRQTRLLLASALRSPEGSPLRGQPLRLPFLGSRGAHPRPDEASPPDEA